MTKKELSATFLATQINFLVWTGNMRQSQLSFWLYRELDLESKELPAGPYSMSYLSPRSHLSRTTAHFGKRVFHLLLAGGKHCNLMPWGFQIEINCYAYYTILSQLSTQKPVHTQSPLCLWSSCEYMGSSLVYSFLVLLVVSTALFDFIINLIQFIIFPEFLNALGLAIFLHCCFIFLYFFHHLNMSLG